MSLRDLFTEKNQEGEVHISLGRVSFWILFAVIIYLALSKEPVNDNLIYFATALLAYSGYKKWPEIKETLKNGINKKS